jgi:hypothetical protein
MDGPFQVTFEIARGYQRRPTPDHETWTLEDLTGGFWVTADHILCRPSQGKYFIPPSRIVLIEKRS